MLLKTIVVLMMLAILTSLGSALTYLLRRGQHGKTKMARALTWRIGLSMTLFLLLMAGYFFGLFTPHGLSR